MPIIFEELLPSYGTVEGIATALDRLSRRIKRANPLSGGERELLLHHDALLGDFRGFTPEVVRFVGEVITPAPLFSTPLSTSAAQEELWK